MASRSQTDESIESQSQDHNTPQDEKEVCSSATETIAVESTNQAYVEELTYLVSLAKHPKTISLLQAALTKTQVANGGSSIETVSKATITPSKVTREKVASIRINEYGWDQSDRYVKFYITSVPGLGELVQENLRTQFKERSMEVELLHVRGKNYSLVINDLFSPVIPSECSAKVRSGVVTISLRKSKKENWQFLTQREKKLKDTKETKPPKMDKDEDPGAGLMKLMKQMYDEGDDEMKRTIAKAWHESREKRSQEGVPI